MIDAIWKESLNSENKLWTFSPWFKSRLYWQDAIKTINIYAVGGPCSPGLLVKTAAYQIWCMYMLWASLIATETLVLVTAIMSPDVNGYQ